MSKSGALQKQCRLPKRMSLAYTKFGILHSDWSLDSGVIPMNTLQVELQVKKNKVVPHRLGVQKFKDFATYLDILSLLVPIATVFTGQWRYQVVRLVRLKWFYDFEKHFCRSFKVGY